MDKNQFGEILGQIARTTMINNNIVKNAPKIASNAAYKKIVRYFESIEEQDFQDMLEGIIVNGQKDSVAIKELSVMIMDMLFSKLTENPLIIIHQIDEVKKGQIYEYFSQLLNAKL